MTFERYWQGLKILTVGGTGLMMAADREQVVAIILDFDGFEAAVEEWINPDVQALRGQAGKYAQKCMSVFDDWLTLQDRVRKYCEEAGVSEEVIEELLGGKAEGESE